MQTFNAPTANDLWALLCERFRAPEVNHQSSDRGPTRELLHVGFSLSDPSQRWISSRRPPVNVAFALAEVLWILCGRRDAAFLGAWNSQLAGFVGGEPTHHGAYGYRLRAHFGIDQLQRACEALSRNPDSRQVVLQLWDPRHDLPDVEGRAVSGDIPCNVVSLLKVREGRLEWMQVMRSNDLFRGLPYNIVQFTFLQEVFAGWLGIGMGTYNQLSDSLHMYEADRLTIEARGEPRRFASPSYALPWGASVDVLGTVLARIEVLSKRDVALREVFGLHEGLPPAYANIVVVLAAEKLRRLGHRDEAAAIAAACTDPALSTLWTQWYQTRPTTNAVTHGTRRAGT